MEDPESLINRALSQRGPRHGQGPGRPWNGIVERTPCLWISWIRDATKHANISPDQIRAEFYDVPIQMTSVELTFGRRWYWLCPRCARRCEAVYYAGEVGCRVCLHLGYLSQSRRPTSAWLWLDRIGSRHWPLSPRYCPADGTEAIVKKLGEALREELRELVAQIEIRPVDNDKVEEGDRNQDRIKPHGQSTTKT